MWRKLLAAWIATSECFSSIWIPEDAYVVGMVGRISPQKAPDVFVKMAKLVKDEIPNAHFVIVGSGNQEAEIRKYAEENKFADSLHITGWVDDPMSYVELFDVACLLSRWEGFGLALPEYFIEYLATNKKVERSESYTELK